MSDPRANPSSPQTATRNAEPSAACDLCGAEWAADVYTKAVWEATGLDICPDCLEAMLDAPADDERTALGLVGKGH